MNEQLGAAAAEVVAQIQRQQQVYLGIKHEDGMVIMDFATEVRTISLDPRQAAKIGRGLLRHARKAVKHG